MRRNRQKEKTPDASVHISPSIPGMAAVILPIVLRRSALWYIQIKFSSSTVKCIIPHTSNSFFLVLAAAFFGLVACLLSASCLRIDGRGLRILTSRRSSLLIIPTQMEKQNFIMKKRAGEVRLPSDHKMKE